MNLWTEYEGATIDSAYALNKLLQTEGRSAFFTTVNENGESVLIRIIECHFDEDEILSRWRGVQSLDHPNFLNIDRFDRFKVENEDTTAVYAVFERVDANLGEVLQRGCLSKADAAEIGYSVASALETLHAGGFVHEHVVPANIYSAGETVKLRSDCIRETPEAPAGVEARQQDVRDLAGVLMQVLPGARRGSTAAQINLLPAPFDEIVRNGMNGSWGLSEMKAALAELNRSRPIRRKEAPAKSIAVKGPGGVPATQKPLVSSVLTAVISPAARSGGSSEKLVAAPAEKEVNPGSKPERPEPFEPPAPPVAHADAFPLRRRSAMELPVIFGISEQDFRKWTTLGVIILGVVLIGWIVAHQLFGHSTGASAQPDAPQQPAVAISHPAATPKTMSSAANIPAAPAAHEQPGVQWRVVVFTYNNREQAEKKASSLAHEHPELAAAVFSPMNRVPWLVTIGGSMERDKAYELARRAHSLGLPRDAYAQNYRVK